MLIQQMKHQKFDFDNLKSSNILPATIKGSIITIEYPGREISYDIKSGIMTSTNNTKGFSIDYAKSPHMIESTIPVFVSPEIFI